MCLFAIYHLLPQSVQAALAAGCLVRNSTVITHQYCYTFVIVLALHFKHFHGIQKAGTCPANSVNHDWVGPLSSEMGNSVLLTYAWSEGGLVPAQNRKRCMSIYLFILRFSTFLQI